jgi:signal transduction histidine kinase
MHGDVPTTAPARTARPGRLRWSIEWTLPLLISTLLVLVVAIYGGAAYEEMRTSSVAAATARLHVVSRQLADLARSASVPRAAMTRLVADDSATRRLLERGGPTTRPAALLARAVASGDSTLIAAELWSADGVRRFAQGEPATPADSVELRRTMLEAAHADSLRRSPFYRVGERVYSWTVLPAHDGGRIIGFVAERRRVGNSPTVERQIRRLTGQDVSVLVANDDGRFWSDLLGHEVAPPFALQPPGRVFRTVGPHGERLYASRAPVAGAPYSLIVSIPAAGVLRRPRDFLRRMLGIGLVLLVVGAAGAWVLSRHVTRPLRTVTEAAEAVAAGQYAHRVEVRRRDELGRLAHTFNSMAARIGASHDELAFRAEQASALAMELALLNDELRVAEEDTRRAVRRMQRLHTVTGALAGAVDFQGVANVFLSSGLEAAGAAAGAIFMIAEDHAALSLVRSAGYPAGTLPVGTRLDLETPSAATEAARTNAPVFVESLDAWTARYSEPSAHTPSRNGAWAAIPLVARGRTIGIMGLTFASATTFDAETRAFLMSLAQQCGQALDRATLFDSAVQARQAAEEARATAQEANRAKSAFLAMMSHELRTPLNAIGGYTELLQLGLRGPVTDAQSEDLTRIRRNKDHLLSIINDILNLARIEAGQVALRLDDVRVDELLTETEAAVAPQIAAKQLTYDVTVPDGGCSVRGDREKLQQVLLNLVSNAVRFTDVGGTITVACETEGDEVHVVVRDTGIGIPAEKLDAIFEPFVQVDTGLTRRTGGTGLGLAISRDLATAMGGRITVASELGRGSTFTLTLPRAGVAAADGREGDAGAVAAAPPRSTPTPSR